MWIIILHSNCRFIFLFSWYILSFLRTKTVIFSSLFPQGLGLWHSRLWINVCWVSKYRASPLNFFFLILHFTSNKSDQKSVKLTCPRPMFTVWWSRHRVPCVWNLHHTLFTVGNLHLWMWIGGKRGSAYEVKMFCYLATPEKCFVSVSSLIKTKMPLLISDSHQCSDDFVILASRWNK